MSERLLDVFHARHRVPREVLRRLEPGDLDEIEASVLGETHRSFRIRAMDVLVAARGAGATKALAQVLADDREDVSLRAAAAAQLGRAGPSAETPLLSALQEGREPTILVAVAGALAKVGSAAALEALSAVADRDDAVGRQARFAATVIAFREHRPGYEPPSVADSDVLPVPEQDLSRLRQRRLRHDEVRAALDDLRQDSFGVQLAEEEAFSIECAQERFIVVLDADSAVREQPTLSGLVAHRSYETGTYSVSWLVLAWPGDDGATRVAVHRPSGQQVLAGTARFEGDQATFDLLSVRGRGNLAVEVHGSLEKGRIVTFEGTAGRGRPERGEPTPEG